MMVGSGTTTVWCGVTFVPNLLLLFFYTEHKLTHTKKKPFVCGVDGCDYAAARKDLLKSMWFVCGYNGDSSSYNLDLHRSR